MKMINRAPVPERYVHLSQDQLEVVVTGVKSRLGSRLVLLGHHYQPDEILRWVDFTGDSLKLSQLAAAQKQADYIVFCGVHFMAESAVILAEDRQRVFLPEMTAGCPMADMADITQVEQCRQWLMAAGGFDRVVPVTYVNSTAEIKAFCGRHGGLCCTSSNCRAVLESVWRQRPEAMVLFLPDQHLGRNVAFRMGVGLEQMAVWDPRISGGGLAGGGLEHCRLLLWKGYCVVHQRFNVGQIDALRQAHPDIRVIVHPECDFETANRADLLGSTDQIIKTVSASPSGSIWAVGTEIKLVTRLGEQLAPRGIKVLSLNPQNSLCLSMARISLPHLAWILDNLAAYEQTHDESLLENQIRVTAEVKAQARLALERMLAVVV